MDTANKVVEVGKPNERPIAKVWQRVIRVIVAAVLFVTATVIFAGCGLLDSGKSEPVQSQEHHIWYSVTDNDPTLSDRINIEYEIEGRGYSISSYQSSSWDKAFNSNSGIAFVKATWHGRGAGLYYARGSATVRIYVDGEKRIENTGSVGPQSVAAASCAY